MSRAIRVFKKIISVPQYLLGKPKDEIFVFVHLPKCGGTTLNNIIKINYNPWRTFEFVARGRRGSENNPLNFGDKEAADIKYILTYLKKYESKIDVIIGHMPYGVHKYLNRRCRYFSVIRDPIKRVWSQFVHIANRTDHYLYPILRKHAFKLDHVLESGEVMEFRNDQVRMLLGSGKVDFDPTDSQNLIDRIKKSYFYIDVLENFEKIVPNLADYFNWKDTTYINENLGSYEKFGHYPEEEIVQKIIKHNFLDLKLYEYISNISNSKSFINHY